jgi:serine/threonine protein kinase
MSKKKQPNIHPSSHRNPKKMPRRVEKARSSRDSRSEEENEHSDVYDEEEEEDTLDKILFQMTEEFAIDKCLDKAKGCRVYKVHHRTGGGGGFPSSSSSSSSATASSAAASATPLALLIRRCRDEGSETDGKEQKRETNETRETNPTQPEISIMNKIGLLNNPHLPVLLQAKFFPGPSGSRRGRDHYVLVMPYYKHDDVWQTIFRHDRRKRRLHAYFLQLFRTLECLHNAGIFHRDIKFDNVLWNSEKESIVLIDYDLSFAVDLSDSGRPQSVYVGTVGYMAPELELLDVLKSDSENRRFPNSLPLVMNAASLAATDIYSCGILLAEMLLELLDEDIETLKGSGISNLIQARLQDKKSLSEFDKNGLLLAQRMLESSPKQRIQMTDILKHPFWNA